MLLPVLRQGSPEHIYCLVPTGYRWEPVLEALPRGDISRAPRLVTGGRASDLRSVAEPPNEGKTPQYTVVVTSADQGKLGEYWSAQVRHQLC